MTGQEGHVREWVADAALLAAMHEASFPPAERWNQAAFASLLDLPGCFACLHRDDAAPTGMALLRAVMDEAELLTIGVLPEARGKGVGAWLLARALVECARRGVGRVFLEVAPDNLAACALYRRQGFLEIGRRRRYYPDGSDALVMEWSQRRRIATSLAPP